MHRVLVIGLGLIGGSIASRLRSTGASVDGYDSSPATATRALELGLVDRLIPAVTSVATDIDAVIVSVPVLAIVDLLPAIDAATPISALILDTGSVKLPIVERMAELPNATRCIGGHPVAGAERSGPEAADPRLLEGHIFVLSPSRYASPAHLERARDLVEDLAMRPRMLSAGEHDRILAHTSHLPQFLATALALSLGPGDGEFSGPALRDMTRLAASEPALWRDIAATNRGNIVEAMRHFRREFDTLMDMMQLGDLTGIEESMRRGLPVARKVRSGEPM